MVGILSFQNAHFTCLTHDESFGVIRSTLLEIVSWNYVLSMTTANTQRK